jgi:hypothetical protein
MQPVLLCCWRGSLVGPEGEAVVRRSELNIHRMYSAGIKFSFCLTAASALESLHVMSESIFRKQHPREIHAHIIIIIIIIINDHFSQGHEYIFLAHIKYLRRMLRKLIFLSADLEKNKLSCITG